MPPAAASAPPLAAAADDDDDMLDGQADGGDLDAVPPAPTRAMVDSTAALLEGQSPAECAQIITALVARTGVLFTGAQESLVIVRRALDTRVLIVQAACT